MPDIKRYVIGPGQDGHSAVLETELTNVQTREGFYARATLWATREIPVDNSIGGNRSLTEHVGARREPLPGGMLVRALELWPDMDPDEHRKQFAELNAQAEQKRRPSASIASSASPTPLRRSAACAGPRRRPRPPGTASATPPASATARSRVSTLASTPALPKARTA